jgi:hypothetical protein
MKKSKLFMATGALVLAVSAIFATKANKKFTASFITGYSQASPSNFSIKTALGNAWLTASNTGHPAIVAIVTGGRASTVVFQTQLYTHLGTKALYY